MDKPKIIHSKNPFGIGIDLHKKKWVITVRSKELELKTFVAPPDKEKLVKTLNTHFPGAHFSAVYEAGCFGYHFAHYLNGLGIPTIIVSPHKIPVVPGDFVKTDKRDSRKLAKLLARGDLIPIRIPDKGELFHRAILRKREQFKKRKVTLQNQIKSDLLFHGIEIPNGNKRYWSKSFIRLLRTLRLGDVRYEKAFHHMLDEYEEIKQHERSLECFS